MTRAAHVCTRHILATLALSACVAMVAHAGPVESYREGPRFCPHDVVNPGAALLTEPQVDARALALLPGFCGPSYFVSGCYAQPEFLRGQWRVYVRQYQLHDGQRVFGGLEHSYVILDRVGNCMANIPGTPLGATR
ncbi:MAG: hypothetical protein ABI440_04085 [Casimicrobiaceae bacterium]